MGKGYLSESLFMASAIHAKNRWLLTGTPTPSDPTQTLAYLYHQFQFLNHPLFKGAKLTKHEIWRKLFSRVFSEGSDPHYYGGVESLIRLLSSCMIRHSKQDILDIPKPVYKVTKLVLSSEEKKVYNSFVALARCNLILTSLDYKTPGAQHPDSLLNAKNKKSLSELIYNLRLATAGGGVAPLILPNKTNTLSKIQDSISHLPNKDLIIKALEFLITQTVPDTRTVCERCSKLVAPLILTPCCHMVSIQLCPLPPSLEIKQYTIYTNSY